MSRAKMKRERAACLRQQRLQTRAVMQSLDKAGNAEKGGVGGGGGADLLDLLEIFIAHEIPGGGTSRSCGGAEGGSMRTWQCSFDRVLLHALCFFPCKMPRSCRKGGCQKASRGAVANINDRRRQANCTHARAR
jgi:hypothetical protein